MIQEEAGIEQLTVCITISTNHRYRIGEVRNCLLKKMYGTLKTETMRKRKTTPQKKVKQNFDGSILKFHNKQVERSHSAEVAHKDIKRHQCRLKDSQMNR